MLAQKKTVGYECQRYKTSSTNPRAALKLGKIHFIKKTILYHKVGRVCSDAIFDVSVVILLNLYNLVSG